MSFMSRWWKGTKQVASSPAGALQAGLIINAFIVVGCFLGAWEVKQSNGLSAMAFVLFAFGLLNFIMWFTQLKQYKAVKQQERIMKELERGAL